VLAEGGSSVFFAGVGMVGEGAYGGWPAEWWLLALYCGGWVGVRVGCRVLLRTPAM